MDPAGSEHRLPARHRRLSLQIQED